MNILRRLLTTNMTMIPTVKITMRHSCQELLQPHCGRRTQWRPQPTAPGRAAALAACRRPPVAPAATTAAGLRGRSRQQLVAVAAASSPHWCTGGLCTCTAAVVKLMITCCPAVQNALYDSRRGRARRRRRRWRRRWR